MDLTSFHLFPLLPIELRRKIWLSTTEPRTLTLSLYLKMNLVRYNGAIASPRTMCISIASFGAREGFHPHPHHITEQSGPSCKGNLFRNKPFLSEAQMRKSLPGPMILVICRESREVGLERYERAFGGVNIVRHVEDTQRMELRDDDFHEKFENSGISEPKIWIDFKRDTVVLVGADGDGGRWEAVRNEPRRWAGGLSEYVRYAEKEIKKMRSVVMAGVLFEMQWQDGMDWSPTREGDVLEKALKRHLRKFERLELLRVCSTNEYRVVRPPMGTIVYNLRSCGRTVGWTINLGNVDIMRRAIMERLEAEQWAQKKEWLAKLPQIEISRAVQWEMDGSNPVLTVHKDYEDIFAEETYGRELRSATGKLDAF